MRDEVWGRPVSQRLLQRRANQHYLDRRWQSLVPHDGESGLVTECRVQRCAEAFELRFIAGDGCQQVVQPTY